MSDEIDVLDDDHINQYEMHLHTLHADSAVVEHSLKKCPMWNSIRDAIARLRARNEALEKVAKAALREEHQSGCGVFIHAEPGSESMLPCDCIHKLALSALNPSGPNSSGGET